MLFNSLAFAIFLPAVFLLYWLTPPKRRWLVLLLSSYYFYMSWNVRYVVLILLTTAVSYGCALLIERDRAHKKPWLVLSLLVCLGVLFFFKYFNFVSESVAALLRRFGLPLSPLTLRLALPVGISFYTFQTLSYVIDVYRGGVRAERHFGRYAAFVSFFPQLVAGPIERTENLLPQINRAPAFDYEQAARGMLLMAWGFFKKTVVADNLAVTADLVYDDVYAFGGFALILATLCFTVQIYCDFSGYSDIARGAARLFGVELMRNFRSPYLSASLREFWSRWHISLSTWFRDYVYIPLGGSRVSRPRAEANLMLTFLASGLWHGASWSFVIWGAVHGAAQVLERRLGLHRPPEKRPVRVLRAFAVFLFSAFAWVFFRAQTLSEAVYVLTHCFRGIGQPLSYLREGFLAAQVGKGKLAEYLLVFLLPLFLVDRAALKTDVIAWVRERPFALRHLICCALLLAILLFHAGGEVAFVYFQF